MNDKYPKITVGVFGPTAIFSALAIGAGELMFWPGRVLSEGAGILWVAILVVGIQWVINIEVARFSLVTGKTFGAKILERSTILAVFLVLGAIIPWIWPGWIRGGAQFASAIGLGTEVSLSLFIAVASALCLCLPKENFRVLAVLQSVALAVMLLGVVIVFVIVCLAKGGFVTYLGELSLIASAFEAIPLLTGADDVAFYGLLGGIVFAGAGGILNLGYGYLVLKRGGWGTNGVNREMFPGWMRLFRIEHVLLFALANIFSIIFISAIYWMLFQGATPVSGIGLLKEAFTRLQDISEFASITFAISGLLIFWTSSLGILDFSSRIAADIVSSHLNSKFEFIYRFFVMGQTALACCIIISPLSQPFWLIVISGVINCGVMALYSSLLLWLNTKTLPEWARCGLGVKLVLLLAVLIYGGLLGVTLWRIS